MTNEPIIISNNAETCISVRANQPSGRNCTFCKVVGHRTNTCTLRLSFKRTGEEYSSAESKTLLRHRMENIMPIRHPLENVSVLNTISSQLSRIRHLSLKGVMFSICPILMVIHHLEV